MKKILLAFEGAHYSNGAVACARWINQQYPILLTGAFLPHTDYVNLSGYAGKEVDEGKYSGFLEKTTKKSMQHNMDRFSSMCNDNQIRYKVHCDFSDFALPELRKETRYADMLVLGSESFFADWEPEATNIFLNDILHHTECPVMLVPEKFCPPSKNIIAYDGSASSVYAIKQFAALFPALCQHETLVINAGHNATAVLPDENNIHELCSAYFPHLKTVALDINPQKYFATWMKEYNNALLITGAFGRSAFSRLFKKSFLSEVLKNHSVPLFIAHR